MNLKKPIIYSICVLLLFSFSCKNKNNKVSKNIKPDITLKVSEAIENQIRVFEYKDFVDSIAYIKLETTNNALIKYIDKLLVHNRCIYLQTENQLLVFEMSGKLKFTINSIGRGPNEYLDLTSFSLKRNDNIIIIYDYISKKILKYNANNGSLINKSVFKDKKFYALDVYAMENGEYICYSPNFNYGSKYYSGIFIVDAKGNFKTYIYEQKDAYPVIGTIPKQMYIKQLRNNVYSIFEPINNCIYHYDGEIIKNTYQFEFSYPGIEYTTLASYKGKSSIPNQQNNFVTLSRYHETDRNIFMTWIYNNKPVKSIYFKNEKKYKGVLIEKFMNDLFGYQVSIDNSDILCYEIPSDLSIELSKNKNLDSKIRQKLKCAKIEDNPTLVLYYLK